MQDKLGLDALLIGSGRGDRACCCGRWRSFAILAAIFAFALRSGDPSKLPSALIGKPVPDIALARRRGAQRRHAPGRRLCRRRSGGGPGLGRELLGLLVRAVRAGAPAAGGPEGADRRPALRRQLQGPGGGRAPLPRPLRQSLRGGRRRRRRPRRHRVGRLRHARDVRRRRPGPHRLQARRPDHGAETLETRIIPAIRAAQAR